MKHFAATLIVLCASACTLSAQDFNLTGAGARAEGLGGAFIGLADDATAIVWNPAGLVQLERAEASVVARYLTEKAEYTYTDFPANNTSLDQSHVSFNFGSFALPFKMGGTTVVIAAAYQRQLDFYANLKSAGGTSERKGGADTFTPGIAVKITPVISIGVAANIWTGKDDLTATSTGFAGTTTGTQSITYKGFNLAFGGMVDFEALPKPVPLKFGITVRTPFDLTADGSQTYILGSQQSQFTANRTVQMPLMIGFGTSYRFSENFTAAIDYETRSFGDREFTDVVSGAGSTQTSTNPISQSKENLNQVRVGAEYLLVSPKYAVPIRVGYKTMPTLSANFDINNNPSEQVSGKAFSVGSGYIATAFAIDVSYTMTDYTQTYAALGSIKYTVGTLGASLIIYL